MFNLGPLEIIFIAILMFALLGPRETVRMAYRAGASIRRLLRSPLWQEIQEYSREIRELPTKLVRETGLEEDLAEIRKTTTEVSQDINQTLEESAKEINSSTSSISTDLSSGVNQIVEAASGSETPLVLDPSPAVAAVEEANAAPADETTPETITVEPHLPDQNAAVESPSESETPAPGQPEDQSGEAAAVESLAVVETDFVEENVGNSSERETLPVDLTQDMNEEISVSALSLSQTEASFEPSGLIVEALEHPVSPVALRTIREKSRRANCLPARKRQPLPWSKAKALNRPQKG